MVAKRDLSNQHVFAFAAPSRPVKPLPPRPKEAPVRVCPRTGRVFCTWIRGGRPFEYWSHRPDCQGLPSFVAVLWRGEWHCSSVLYRAEGRFKVAVGYTNRFLWLNESAEGRAWLRSTSIVGRKVAAKGAS